MRSRWGALIAAAAALAATFVATPAQHAEAAPPLFTCSGSPRDYNNDNKADVYGFDHSGRIWLIPGNGQDIVTFSRRVNASGQGFYEHLNNFTYVGKTKSSPCTVYARDTLHGELVSFIPDRYGHIYEYELRKNFSGYTKFTGVGDLTNSGYGDMLARDKAGVLWLFRGTNGPAYNDVFKSRIRVPGSWGSATALVGAGDVTGDGKPDLLARDHTGVLRLYPGTGHADKPFGSAIRLSGNWNWATAFIGGADYNGDNKPDLVARDSAGRVWLAPGRRSTKTPFGARTQIATGWSGYSFLF